MRADFFTKPLQGMLFYCVHDLIMNIAPESPYHSSHRSVLRDTTEGLNKQNDNPAQRKITPQTGEVHDTSVGASISARNERISTYCSDKSTLDGESYDVHTQYHNSNQFIDKDCLVCIQQQRQSVSEEEQFYSLEDCFS